ncbi:uncharacterized protein LOC109948674 [Prunus persica]|uniref:uncharacterized protein LOC109948674 n=1 Tax=Prunus persica TaxID=3760 RepID=UPI0009AB381E|nr:uncharacterized protein LOC109948674 [Prunus persica]
MKVGESVDEYFGRPLDLTMANKRRINGEKLEDVAVIEKILRSMTPKFDYVVCSIEESKDLDNLSIDELQSSLLGNETKANVVETEEELLLMAYVEVKGKQMNNTWYLDSSCSNHMSGTKKMFTKLDEKFRENVKLGNDSSLKVQG